jgi:cyclic pyranopterin phosphate synthase
MPKRVSAAAKQQGFTHLRSDGSAWMVDVSGKLPSERAAVAHARVLLKPAVLRQIRRSGGPKGNPLEVARLAGILAAKRTAELIPLCHPLPLTHADVETRYVPQGVEILARVKTTAPTGVEMEALVAAAVAALTVYDMCKALDRGITISDLYLVEKSGGRSGTYRRDRS